MHDPEDPGRKQPEERLIRPSAEAAPPARPPAPLGDPNTFAQTIIAGLGEGVIVYDRDLRYRLWNRFMEELTGLSAAEVLGKSAIELFPHIREQGVDRMLTRALAGETVHSPDMPYRVPTSGRHGWVRAVYRPLRDTAGMIVGAIAVVHDITHRREVEESLNRYRLLAENSRDIILFISHRDGRVIEANRAALSAYGYASTELLGLTIHDLRAEETQPEVNAQMSEADAAGILFETMHRRKDGRVFPVEVSSRGITVHGERMLISIIRDITERKQAEDRLHQALADKETLLQEVHHRTKNNLQMLCDLLYLKAESVESAEGKRLLEDSYTRIYAFARLHEQLYRSMESGRIRPADYLRGVLSRFEQSYPGARIVLDVEDRETYLDLDRAISVGLIVNELLMNSLKHAFPPDRPGELGVRLGRSADRYRLEVWDKGCGLPPDFDPQGNRSLGLRLVHLLARRLAATIQVDGTGGARFVFGFPVKPAA